LSKNARRVCAATLRAVARRHLCATECSSEFGRILPELRGPSLGPGIAAVAVILSLLAVAFASANPRYPAEIAKPEITFGGELSAGKSIHHAIGSNLVFWLVPSPASFGKGWDIEVMPKGNPESGFPEYAAMATPPYHMYKPTYVNASYGVSAQQAVAMSPRKFYFVETADDSQAASAVVNTVVYSLDWQSRKDSLAAQAAEIALGAGELTIVQSRITPGRNNEDLGSIDWIKFQVRLTLQSGITLRDILFPGPARAAPSADQP
jgi:hypothetical protein